MLFMSTCTYRKDIYVDRIIFVIITLSVVDSNEL